MTDTLFDDQLGDLDADGGLAPLADRMRPRTLDEVIGQATVADGGFIRRAICEDRVPSVILWGPPGSGKTTVARLIAQAIPCRFVPFSAVTSGIKEVKEVMAGTTLRRDSEIRRTVLFVDEIHRFNRAQQDAFLPYVERGDILLIGATTENPSFHINGALMSRCRLVSLRALTAEEIEILLRRALADRKRGLGELSIEVSDDALQAIAQLASGDARRALNLLELAALDVAAGDHRRVDAAGVSRVAQRKVLLYDRAGEEHYSVISAFHKSLRESDPDASLYWLARMLTAGEDPLYVARRLVRFASEDVGLADPHALSLAITAWQAFHRLGSPEGELALAQATVYLALAPKSNSVYRGFSDARKAVEESPAEPVPPVLRNAVSRLMEEQGYGRGYVYAHDTLEGIGGVNCLPEALRESCFYRPTERGFERRLAVRLKLYRRLRRQARGRVAAGDDADEAATDAPEASGSADGSAAARRSRMDPGPDP